MLFFVIICCLFSCRKGQKINAPVKDFVYEEAKSFVDKNNDSAFFYFNKVAINSKDSLKVAVAYNYMAVIQADAGDYFGGQESLLSSLKFLDESNEKDFECLTSNYNELGKNCVTLKNYDAAIQYYDLALKFSVYKDFELVILNNKAIVYQKKKKYAQAIKIYNAVLNNNKDNKIVYARALSNLSKTKWLQDPAYNAGPQLIKALHIREKQNDGWGENASYSHLADYYTFQKPDSALFYALKRYRISREIQSPDDRLEALQKLIMLSPPKGVKQYFEIYQNLNDSLQTTRNSAKNQFALIRYEAEKNKVAYLKLQKDNTAKRYQIVKQNVMLFGALFLLVGGSCSAIYWYRRRKQRMELQSLNAIRESQLKTSKRVHDVVANGLYRVMSEMQNQEGMDKEAVLDKIDDLYEKSRDISYEKPEVSDQDFDRRIAALLLSFSTEKTKVAIAGNTLDLWAKVNSAVRYEIEHILQELMVNMKKHSGASNVTIRFNYKNDEINIFYTDNGAGMPEGTNFKNGLRNTGNRIEDICGEIIFDTKLEKGLKIQISFPIS